jgi:hypothetical protein
MGDESQSGDEMRSHESMKHRSSTGATSASSNKSRRWPRTSSCTT